MRMDRSWLPRSGPTAAPTTDGWPTPGGNTPGASSRRSLRGRVSASSTTSSSLAVTSPPSRRVLHESRILIKIDSRRGDRLQVRRPGSQLARNEAKSRVVELAIIRDGTRATQESPLQFGCSRPQKFRAHRLGPSAPNQSRKRPELYLPPRPPVASPSNRQALSWLR